MALSVRGVALLLIDQFIVLFVAVTCVTTCNVNVLMLQDYHKDDCLIHCKLFCSTLATSFATHDHQPITQYPLLYSSYNTIMNLVITNY